MSTPLHAFLTGSFLSDGLARNLSLPSGYQKFSMVNLTDVGSAAAATPVMRASATSLMPAGSAYLNLKTNGAATLQLESMITVDGFTFVADSGALSPSAPIAVTGVTNAAPPVAATASTAGLANGDIVRLSNTTGALNLGGIDFTIGSLVANTSFELAYMVAPGAAAVAGFWRRIPFDARYYPRNRVITSISQAASAVIVMSVTHGFTVGQKVRINVPKECGMVEMNGLLGTITAINTATNSITVDINSSGFSAFTFPTSAQAAAGVSYAQVVPVGEAATAPFGNNLDDATFNTSFSGVIIGSGAQTAGKRYQWFAEAGVAL